MPAPQAVVIKQPRVVCSVVSTRGSHALCRKMEALQTQLEQLNKELDAVAVDIKVALHITMRQEQRRVPYTRSIGRTCAERRIGCSRRGRPSTTKSEPQVWILLCFVL